MLGRNGACPSDGSVHSPQPVMPHTEAGSVSA